MEISRTGVCKERQNLKKKKTGSRIKEQNPKPKREKSLVRLKEKYTCVSMYVSSWKEATILGYSKAESKK